MKFVDAEGNEYESRVVCGYGFDIDRDGNVHSYSFDHRDGSSEERTEHISESPVRGALPEWAWDLTLDPRS